MNENTDLMTTSEAANRLSVTRMTVGRWVKSGRLASTRIGKRTFIPGSEVTRLKPIVPQTNDSASIEEAVDRAVNEYGEVLKRLGQE